MRDPLDTEWTCPECGQPNIDDFANTTAPTCEHCDYHSWMWDDVLTDEQMDHANALLDLQLPDPA